MLKRTIDIMFSAGVLVLLTPVFALGALAVVMESGWPPCFSQVRVGRNFQRFRVWKFRSMQRNNSGPKITVEGDCRITRVGKILRATKLDELPQVWNVLVGEMSLVGPRPEVPEYVEMYRERYRGILTVRPGITDLASIRYRDEERLLAAASSPEEYYARHVLPAKLDLAEEYLRRQSLPLDLSILARTCAAVVRAA